MIDHIAIVTVLIDKLFYFFRMESHYMGINGRFIKDIINLVQSGFDGAFIQPAISRKVRYAILYRSRIGCLILFLAAVVICFQQHFGQIGIIGEIVFGQYDFLPAAGGSDLHRFTSQPYNIL